jgi:hypothetical protein
MHRTQYSGFTVKAEIDRSRISIQVKEKGEVSWYFLADSSLSVIC